jgi:hypothetical protein
VSVEQAMGAPSPALGAGARLAAAVLIALMAIGSVALWILVPLGSLWVASQLVGSSAEEYVVGLPLTVVAMVLFGMILGRLNWLYLRITGVIARYEAEEEEFGVAPPFLRGPLEPLLVGSLVIAIVALAIWFLFIARNPPLVPL